MEPRSGGLDDACLLESGECAVLLDGLDGLGRDVQAHALVELRNEDRLLLEVRLAALLASRVELGSTRPVGVVTGDEGGLIGDGANLVIMFPFMAVSIAFCDLIHEKTRT